MNGKMKRLVSVLMCLVLFVCLGNGAFAALETTAAPENALENPASIIDDTVISQKVQALIDTYTTANYIKPAQVSIAYTYLATGDSWYLNPDTWYYSASTYKVPLMMILAEREAKGELTADTQIEGATLADIEYLTIVNSNNDTAHASLRFISGKDNKKESELATRPLYMAYTDLPESYYHSDFVNYSYFSVRFLNEVMETLYSEPNSFPRLTDLLKQAEPDSYMHLKLGDTYQIAQKYGYYKDSRNTVWNNITGIIYTPNPILVTVMTADAAKAEQFIGDVAELLVNYTLELDSQLEAHKQQLALAEAQAEAEAKAAEEAAAQAEAEAKAQAEAAEAQRKAEQEQAVKQAEKQEKAKARKESLGKVLKYVGFAGGGIVIVLVIIGVLTSVRKRRAQNGEDIARRYSDDDDFEYEPERRGGLHPRRKIRERDFDEDEEPDEDLDDDELEDGENEPMQYAKVGAKKAYYDDDVNTPDEDDNAGGDDRNYPDDNDIKCNAELPAPKFKGFSAFKRGSTVAGEDDNGDATLARPSRSSGGYVPRH